MEATKFGTKFNRIEGISDRRRLPRLGKLRLGIKIQKGDKEYPAELPFFRLPEEVAHVYGFRDADIALERAKAMGCTREDVLRYIEKNYRILAEEVGVMFPLEDETAVFPQAYVWYGRTKGAKCRGNGREAERMTDSGMQEIECPCEHLKAEDNPKGECTHRAHLMVLVPKVNMGGVYQVDMGSYHSIVDLNSGIDYVRAMVGRIALIPMTLRRVARETHAVDSKQTHFTLQLICNVRIDQLEGVIKDSSRILTGTERLALPAPEDTNPAFEEGPDVIEVEVASATPADSPTAEPPVEPEKGAGVPESPAEAPAEGEADTEPPETPLKGFDVLLRTCKTEQAVENAWNLISAKWGTMEGPEQKNLIDTKAAVLADIRAGLGGEAKPEVDKRSFYQKMADFLESSATSPEELRRAWDVMVAEKNNISPEEYKKLTNLKNRLKRKLEKPAPAGKEAF